VKGLVVAGAAGDAVDGGVDEAEVVMGVLVGQRHESPHSGAEALVPPEGMIDVLPPLAKTIARPGWPASPATSGTPLAVEIPGTPS
jgi:hypothetical protein